MNALPGLTWEYVAWNMDLHRLNALTMEWNLRPSLSSSMKSIINMIELLGKFEKKTQNRVKKRINDDAVIPDYIPSFDPAKWTVLSESRWG